MNDASPVREPQPGEWLSAADFADVLRLAPLVSIDLIVRSPEGRALLGLRRNEPAKGVWFVPGGRITKNETLAAAFRRISRTELGLEMSLNRARPLGVFDHIHRTNVLGAPGFGTHYVVLAHEITVPPEILALPAEQHGEYQWLSTAELLASAGVHEFTKAHFPPTLNSRASPAH